MFSTLVDESTDISIFKLMDVYARLVDQDVVPHAYFLKDICISDQKSDSSVLFRGIMN